MAKQTSTQTYRVSDEVDAELRRLAKIHGGVDKALRNILRIAHLTSVGYMVERAHSETVDLEQRRAVLHGDEGVNVDSVREFTIELDPE